MEEFKRGYLVRLLEFTKGNVSKAAELAGRYRADFYNLLKKHNLKGNVSKAAELAGRYRADLYSLIKKHNLKPDDFKNPNKG